jgi:hypothetical protein
MLSPDIISVLETDYLTILDHPALTTDMKIGYLMAVIQIHQATRTVAHLPIRDLAKEVRTFVSMHIRNGY